MARLGLKLYYLRTRERRFSQQRVADAIGTGQATLSHIEQGTSMPSVALLLALSKFFNVTPTFLLDEERGVIPVATERWSLRNGLVTAGMWIECSRDQCAETPDQKLLAPLSPGESFYDADAAIVRRDSRTADDAHEQIQARDRDRAATAAVLVDTLEGELRVHPRQRRTVRPIRQP